MVRSNSIGSCLARGFVVSIKESITVNTRERRGRKMKRNRRVPRQRHLAKESRTQPFKPVKRLQRFMGCLCFGSVFGAELERKTCLTRR